MTTEPSFDGGEPVVIVEQPRFHRITDEVVDEPSETLIETVPVEATTRPAEYEEDLSVGPGNVAGRETHTMTTTAKVGRPARHAVRKGAPRAPKPATPVARTRRAPRAEKAQGVGRGFSRATSRKQPQIPRIPQILFLRSR